MAREKGLEPLADRMWAQDDVSSDPPSIAGDFVDPDKGVESAEDALQGARDILAERITENAEWRGAIRDLTPHGRVHRTAKRTFSEGPDRVVLFRSELTEDGRAGKILDAGFDGVYLDLIDAFEYFEGN